MSEETVHITNDHQGAKGPLKVIISGGGTGGHIYPAIAIAHALKELVPDVELLFVGAKGRMEMEKVPEAGYKIKGLWISGFQRSLSPRNLLFPVKLLYSMYKARKIVQEFQPNVVVGVGGYASGPTLKAAQYHEVPTVIQEQNSYAGVTNKLLAEKASIVCVAYDGLENYFPAEKLVVTGNPVRKDILDISGKKEEAAKFFKLDPNKKTILVIGGSLGARTINESIDEGFDKIIRKNVQLIWQTGKNYYKIAKKADFRHQTNNIRITDFIKRMDLAYAMADIVISRAGALSISELCLVHKPAILVPSPNVAEDHQTKNANALSEKGAAMVVKDSESRTVLVDKAIELLNNEPAKAALVNSIKGLGRPNAARDIALQILKVVGREVALPEEKKVMATPGEAKPAEQKPEEERKGEVEVEAVTPAPEKTEAKATTRASDKKNILDKEKFSHVYMLGIGGIGMSALARYFLSMGYQVAGYDKNPSSLTDALMEEGINIHFDDNVKRVPDAFKQKEHTVVVYTPAVPDNMWELNYFRQNEFNVVKRSQVLGLVTKGRNTIAVAGTHGKTTTSTMIAHLLHFAGKKNSAFLGGISANLGTNLLIGDKKGSVVVEADEYDRSFLTLDPDIAIVTSTDADHLDIYETHDAIKEAFGQFVKKLRSKGVLIKKAGLELPVKDNVEVKEYGLNDAPYRAENIRIENGTFVFDYVSPDITINDLTLNVPGFHNVENAVAAITATLLKQVKPEVIQMGIADFSGVKRRFEYIVKTESKIYIDDYAHHPVELNALLKSARALYPTKKICIVFQPHLYTRTRDFAQEFGESFSSADQVLLLDIYPARELPIPNVSSELIFEHIKVEDKKLLTKQSLMTALSESSADVIITAGAGDIDRFIEPIKKLVESELEGGASK